MKDKTAIIVGAGLVGSLWAVYLSKAGYKVRVYEMRSDIRKADISAGKSINLALSDRGWRALDQVGAGDEIRKIAIPMYGRQMHDLEGKLSFQAYGKKSQAIYSVSRGGINTRLLDMAEASGNTEVFFNHKCTGADLESGTVYLKDQKSGNELEASADVVFATDGAFSSIRYNAMQKVDRFQYEQRFIEDGYREILLPANEDGSYKLETNALHIWPRGRYMLIALPNEDGSFTCTLFMPFQGDENSFERLKTTDQVKDFFKAKFPDFYELMPDIADKWHDHPLSSLAIIRCYPWVSGKVALMGDAAHATVPFYGQGMNSGFEDCRVMGDLMVRFNEDWPSVFKEFQKVRKPDGDAVQDLSLHNYHVMRDFVADPMFLLQKKIEALFYEKYPDKWMPLYSQVTFSHIPYAEALKVGMRQDQIMKEVMLTPEIERSWDSEALERMILKKLDKTD